MNRRDFLTSVLGASAAATILPQLDLIAASVPASQAQSLAGPVWDATFSEIHKAAAKKYADLMLAGGLPIHSLHPEASRIGDRIITGETVAHQLFVRMEKDGRGIDPAMIALSRRALYCGVDRYAVFRRVPGLIYQEMIGPLRMIAQYHIEFDDVLVRCDIVGASNKEFRDRFRTNELKQRIRQRIASYRSGRKPEMW